MLNSESIVIIRIKGDHLLYSKISGGMIGNGWGNVCYIVNFPPGEYLLHSKVSGGKVYNIVNIPGEGLLYSKYSGGRFTIRHRSFPHSWLITVVVTRLTRRVPLVEQELLSLTEPLNSPPVFSGVRVTRSVVLYVCFVDRCLHFCTFLLAIVLSVLLTFGHCVVCSSSIYGLWLPLWYLQTLIMEIRHQCHVMTVIAGYVLVEQEPLIKIPVYEIYWCAICTVHGAAIDGL